MRVTPVQRYSLLLDVPLVPSGVILREQQDILDIQDIH